MAFDVNGALQAGASEDDVLNHLSESRKFDVQGALKAGASKRDVIDHMAGMNPKSGFFGRIGENLSGLGNLAVGVATHPLETAKSMLTPDPAVAKEAADAFNRGDYGRAAASTVEDIPLIGPQIRRTEQDVRNQDYGAIAGDVATGVALGKAPGLLKKIPGVARAGEVVKAGVRDPLGLQRGARSATLDRMGIPDEVPPPAEPPASASGGQSLPRRILDASRAARKTFKDVKEAPERFIDSMAGKAVDLYDGKVDPPKPPAPPRVPAGALKPPPETPAPAPQPDAIQARRAAHAATRDAIMDRMAPPEPPAATSTPEPPQYERGKIKRGLPPPKAPAPPAGADYVMPPPAPPEPAGRPNVGEPRLGTPPRMPPPTFPQPEAPPPTAPPVKPPPVKPEVPPAEPSAALSAFGIEDAKTISKARARQLATDAGIADVDQFKMLRDEGYKIQDDPFGSGETQRNRRGKATSPEPMKPKEKPPAGEPTAEDIHKQKLTELGRALGFGEDDPLGLR